MKFDGWADATPGLDAATQLDLHAAQYLAALGFTAEPVLVPAAVVSGPCVGAHAVAVTAEAVDTFVRAAAPNPVVAAPSRRNSSPTGPTVPAGALLAGAPRCAEGADPATKAASSVAGGASAVKKAIEAEAEAEDEESKESRMLAEQAREAHAASIVAANADAAARAAAAVAALAAARTEAVVEADVERASGGEASEAVKAAVRDVCASMGEAHVVAEAGTWFGMVNNSNRCYIHAVLQALLGTPPFFDLLARLEPLSDAVPAEEMPVLHAFVSLVRHVRTAPQTTTVSANKRSNVACGAAFEPTYFYDLIEPFVASALNDRTGTEVDGQHDAPEWMEYLIQTLNDELLRADGATFATDLFSGLLESRITTSTGPPSITKQSFQVLSLALGGQATVGDVLVAMASPEQIQDFAPDGAMQTLSLMQLPRVLVLHLKRAQFSHGASTKLTARIKLDLELTVQSNICSPALKPKREREYSLRSVIEHRGESTGSGHYVAHVHHGDVWLELDDADVTAHSTLRADPSGACLLVYQRVADAPPPEKESPPPLPSPPVGGATVRQWSAVVGQF